MTCSPPLTCSIAQALNQIKRWSAPGVARSYRHSITLATAAARRVPWRHTPAEDPPTNPPPRCRHRSRCPPRVPKTILRSPRLTILAPRQAAAERKRRCRATRRLVSARRYPGNAADRAGPARARPRAARRGRQPAGAGSARPRRARPPPSAHSTARLIQALGRRRHALAPLPPPARPSGPLDFAVVDERVLVACVSIRIACSFPRRPTQQRETTSVGDA